MNALEKLLEFIEDTKMDAKRTHLEAILEQDSDLVDLAEGYLIDAEDLRKLYNLMEQKKFKEALMFARSLDTYVREGIPDEVWIELSEHYIRNNQ